MSNESIRVGNDRIEAAVRAVEAGNAGPGPRDGWGWWDGDERTRDGDPIDERPDGDTMDERPDGDTMDERLDGDASVEPPGPVTITSVDARSFPAVTVFFRVDTPAGRAGELTAAEVGVREGDVRHEASIRTGAAVPIDVVLVFDDTGSMLEEVVGARDGITGLVDRFEATGVDARYALVTAQDEVEIARDFTTDRERLAEAVEGLSGSLGADRERIALAPIAVATRREDDDAGRRLSPFRSDANRIVVDVTDGTATTVEPGVDSSTIEHPLASTLRGFGYVEISEPGGALSGDGTGARVPFATARGGVWFERPVRNADAVAELLTDAVAPRLTTTMAATFRSDQTATTTRRSITLQVEDPEEGPLVTRRGYHVS